MHTWEEYIYDIYLEKDIFVHTWVLYTCLIEICVMTYWDTLKLEVNVSEKSESWSYRISKVWSIKFSHVMIFPLVHLGDAS